jgi:DNA topoisomerase-1
MVDGKRMMEDGSELPEHIKKLTIPPAWTDVRINPDPNGDLLVLGKDAKGRVQSVYSEKFAQTQAEAKFMRVQALANEFDDIHKQNEKNRRSRTPRTKDAADCMRLIMQTGIRPGSDEDTGAEKKAYGASNMRAEHVVTEKGKTYLRFTGKKGVDLNIEIEDPETAKMLKRRAKESPDGQLFPNINEKHLLDYTHTLDGGHFKTKDFRTHLGTSTAIKEMENHPKPTNEKEYRKAVLAVAKKVSAKLGNTPTIALQAYINPAVFASWRLN